MRFAKLLYHNLPLMGLLTHLLQRWRLFTRLRARLRYPAALPVVKTALAVGGEVLASRALQEYITLHELRLDRHPIDGFVDVGANIGQNTLAAIAFFGPDVPVYAIEPSTDCASALTSISQQFDRVSFFPIGLGEQSGTFTFNRSTSSRTSQASSFLEFSEKYRAEAPWARAPVVREAIKVLTFDDWLRQHAPTSSRNLMLHIDAEGFDYQVLAGAAPQFDRIAVIIVEVTFDLFEQQKGFEDIMQLLTPHFEFRGGLGAPGLSTDGSPMYQDFLFVRKPITA